MEDLAVPFSEEISRHLALCDVQSTNSRSKFLDSCRAFNVGEIEKKQLVDQTIKLGFKNVIDAFHFVDSSDVKSKFFEDRRSTNGSIVLTDDFLALFSSQQKSNLFEEAEARWRLVETAWLLKLPPRHLNVDYNQQKAEFFIASKNRRISLTSARSALDGYQSGKCFYCRKTIQVIGETGDLAEVDHFFPWMLMNRAFPMNLDLLWNLVLACQGCNRGVGGKFERIPHLKYLERLHLRNESLIKSHKPLRETLKNLAGPEALDRKKFLESTYSEAMEYMNPDPWYVEEVEPT